MSISQEPAYLAIRTQSTWTYVACSFFAAVDVIQFGGSQTAAFLAAALFNLPVVRNVFLAHRERSGDKSPLPSFIRGRGERRSIKAGGLHSWLEQLKQTAPFEDYVTELANCSNLYGRRFSVTCVKIDGLSEEQAERVAGLLRQTVRASDEVRRVGDDEFLVCTPLLRDAIAADIVFTRLRNALLTSSLLEEANTLRLGKALYPRDGYSGPDLIQSARAALRSLASEPTRAIQG